MSFSDNMFPLFVDDELKGHDTLKIIDKYFFKYDMHYNELGNEIIGNYLINNYN